MEQTKAELVKSIQLLRESLHLVGYSYRRINSLIVITVGTEDLERLDKAKLSLLKNKLSEQYAFAQACLKLI